MSFAFTLGSSMCWAMWSIFFGQTNKSTPIGVYGLLFGAGDFRLSLHGRSSKGYIPIDENTNIKEKILVGMLQVSTHAVKGI